MVCNSYPRIVISGLSGDSGKTVVSCGLLACFKDRGIKVAGFKKGPDYVDASWLSLFSDKPARNLDSYMMGFLKVKRSFLQNACKDGINVIEGNRGLFDGVNLNGTYSTAELAKSLDAPVVIVQDISKTTRTAAASILGCLKLDPALKIKGVILNQVAGARHERVTRSAVEEITGIPVIGAVPRLSDELVMPSRHLGLITPVEFEERVPLIRKLKKIINDCVDIEKVIGISRQASTIENKIHEVIKPVDDEKNDNVKIGYFNDKAFSFYYPENLEILIKEGVELIPIDSGRSADLNQLDALYIGGGFPELNLAELVANNEMIEKVRIAAENGLPIYAECGGLMYLAKEIIWKGKKYSLSGVFPMVINMYDKPQGHGYCEMVVDEENPFYQSGTVLKGHEFHYSKIDEFDPNIKSSLAVSKGTGCFNKRDGLVYKNVFASYIHVHALAVPEWVNGMIKCAAEYKKSKLKSTKVQYSKKWIL